MVSEPSLVSKLEPSPITESVPRRNPLHSRQIPWGYGRDRVTATAVDPDRLFIYWELRDEALDAGRERLGPAGARASLVLRVYDTSGRIFDGDNAHSYFDQDVQRSDRQWFCSVGKPASSAHIELGLRTPDGRFLKLVRSGRVDFPRRDPAPWQPPEWMRVVAHTGDIVGRETSRHRGGGASNGAGAEHAGFGGAPAAGGAGGGDAAGETSILTSEQHSSVEYDSYEVRQFDFERYETDTGWQVDPVDPTAVYRMVTLSWQELGMGITSWESGPTESAWQAGPFAYPTEVIAPSVEHYEGVQQVYRSGEQVRVLHGPWQVVIRGINAHQSRRVLARWEVHRSWVSVATRGGESAAAVLPQNGQRPVGASERFLAASELRLRGASEVFFLGASERRLGGASETRFLAASQWIARGASERILKGASEWRLLGSSELRLKGASERILKGASERLLKGASERRLRAGASEQRLGGASEARLGGASEARIVDISSFPPAPSRKG